MTQYVYFFGGGQADGNKDMKDLLGGKGSGLAEMTNAGLPVTSATIVLPSLEDVFLDVVDRQGRGSAAALSHGSGGQA